MELRLTKQFVFDMAHALAGYDGKCSNIHGHTYRFFVTVAGNPITDPSSPKAGMVMDFGVLKRIVNETVVEHFDHALVLNQSAAFDNMLDTKLIRLPFQPTTENLLLHFSRLLEGKLPPGVRLVSLKLFETETSCAELIF